MEGQQGSTPTPDRKNPTTEQTPDLDHYIGKAAVLAARVLLPNILVSHPDTTALKPKDARFANLNREMASFLQGVGVAQLGLAHLHPNLPIAGTIAYTTGKVHSLLNDILTSRKLKRQEGEK